jgi:glutathione S-transferase
VKLYYNKTSPYARKVRVVAIERGWSARLHLVDTDPWSDPAELIAATPLCKVPALDLGGGAVLTESDLIARHLDEAAPGPGLLPAPGAAREQALARLGLAQGVTDAAFDTAMERRRPPDRQWPDWIARRGYDTWCVDMEGYGRSDKHRDRRADVADGADDLAAASDYILGLRGCGPLLLYGISSGSLRAALFAERHPERVRRLAMDATVWTGRGSRTLAERSRRLDQFEASHRRPLDRDFIRSVFTRDHPGVADEATIEAFADAVLALDDSAPTGTYVDMCSRLPVTDPGRILAPTLVIRGEFDGIAAFDDVLEFFRRLPNPDKQFTMLPGIAHASFQERNYRLVYHVLHAFFSRPEPVYRG